MQDWLHDYAFVKTQNCTPKTQKKKPNLINVINGYPLVDTLLSTLYALNYLILNPLEYYYPHFTGGQTQAQGGYETDLGSQLGNVFKARCSTQFCLTPDPTSIPTVLCLPPH